MPYTTMLNRSKRPIFDALGNAKGQNSRNRQRAVIWT